MTLAVYFNCNRFFHLISEFHLSVQNNQNIPSLYYMRHFKNFFAITENGSWNSSKSDILVRIFFSSKNYKCKKMLILMTIINGAFLAFLST